MSALPESVRTATGQSRCAACHSSKEPSLPVERIRIDTRGSGASNVEYHQAFVAGRQLVSDHTIASRATFTVHRMAPPGRSLPFGWSSSGGVRTQFSADYPHHHEHCYQEHDRQPASPIRLLVLHRRPPQISRGRTRRTPGADCRAPQNTYAAFNAANAVRSASAAVNRRNMAAGAARGGGRGGTTATRDSGDRTPILTYVRTHV